MTDACPLCGKKGKRLRCKSSSEILKLYESYLGKPFPVERFPVPLDETIVEYKCLSDALVWYSPSKLGDGEYYSALTKTYSWYYNPESWDKWVAFSLFKNLNYDWCLEIGSGDGSFLKRLTHVCKQVFGIEINPNSLASAQHEVFQVFSPNDLPLRPEGRGVMFMLQTIEHLNEPINVVKKYIDYFKPNYLFISAPCSESFLSLTSDPLSWPPHHSTAWSHRSLEILGNMVGYDIEQVHYSPLTFDLYHQMMAREKTGKIPGVPYFRKSRIGSFLFHTAQILKISKITRNHSILALLKKRS